MTRRSYRIDEPRPRFKQRSMQDTATPGTVFVHQGATAHLAIPCFYQEAHFPVHAHPHDRMLHDTLGWPTPYHPDHSCQEWDFDRHCCRRTPHLKFCPPSCERFVDLGRLYPIHLREEGYEEVRVEQQTGLVTVTGSIDADQDWVVRLVISSEVDMEVTKPQRTSAAVYVTRGDDVMDLVSLVKIIVLPVAIEEADE